MQRKSAHQADLAYQIAQQDLIIRVSEAYFNLLSAKDTLEFAEAQKVAIERQLEQTKQRFSVGLTAITDVHEAQAQFDDSVTQVIRAQNDIYNAEEAIRVLTNVYPRDIYRSQYRSFFSLSSDARQCQRMAANRRSEKPRYYCPESIG